MGKFKSLGEFVTAVKKASDTNGRVIDPRLELNSVTKEEVKRMVANVLKQKNFHIVISTEIGSEVYSQGAITTDEVVKRLGC